MEESLKTYAVRDFGDGKDADCLPSFYTKPTKTVNGSPSDSACIEFSIDQISARSSTADSFNAPNSICGRLSPNSNPISRLFQRYSLDVSVIASSTNYSAIKSTSKLMESTTSSDRDESLNIMKDMNDDLLETNFLKNFDVEKQNVLIGNDSSFITGAAALEMFAKDEEVFKKEAELMLPSNLAVSDEANVGLEQSWTVNSVLDVTRPSWLSSVEDRHSRVSIGTVMRAKTEPLGCLSGGIDGPSFGLESVSPPRHFKPLSETCLEDGINSSPTNDSVISFGSISMAIGDVTASADPKSLGEMFLKMNANRYKGRQEKTKKHEPNTRADPKQSVMSTTRADPKQSVMSTTRAEVTGASFSSKKNENAAKADVCGQSASKDSWVILKTASNKGNNDVNMEMIFEASICQVPLPLSPQRCEKPFATPNRSSSGSNAVPFQLLRSDTAGRLPTLDVPRTLIFVNPCCIGVSTDSNLVVKNPTARFIELKATVMSASCDGRNRSDAQIFTTNVNGFNLEPNASNNLKITFNPSAEGKWEAHMNISCRFLESLTAEWVLVASVAIEAVAICPRIQIVPCDVVDFGVLPESGLQSRSVLVVNKSKANVPICLLIEGMTGKGEGYYFSKTGESTKSDDIQILRYSSVLKYVLSESAEFVVNLKAPLISKYGDETEVVRTTLRFELDSSWCDDVHLGTVLLTAVVGVVRLYTKQDVEPIYLQPCQELPIENRGPFPLQVQLTSQHPDLISVSPSSVLLKPRQPELVRVGYSSKNLYAPPFNSQLLLKIQPDGPLYKINVVGLPLTNVGAVQLLDEAVLQSDRRHLRWGAVRFGEVAEKILVLFNTSPSVTLNLDLLVSDTTRNANKPKNNNPLPFQLAMSSLNGAALTRQTNVAILPMQKLPLTVIYAPTVVAIDCAQLVIKFGNRNDVNDRVKRHTKFTVPLRGCGGGADVHWDGICPSPSDEKRCEWQVDRRTASGEFHLLARNCGQRAAFVKIVSSHNPSISTSSLLSVSVSPSQFILKEGGAQSVTIVCNPSSPSPFYLGLIIGDEILRQRFLLFRSNVSSPLIQNDELEHLLGKDHFSCQLWQQLPVADVRWPPTKSDRRLLLSNMKTMWVAVLPSVFTSTYEEEPSGIFRPLVPEQTFNETTTFVRPPTTTSPPTNERRKDVITVDCTLLEFPQTKVGSFSAVKLAIRNTSFKNEEITVTEPTAPFFVKHKTLTVKQRHYLSLPICFRPHKFGFYSTKVLLHTSNQTVLSILVSGHGV